MTSISPNELVTEFHKVYGMPILPTTSPSVDNTRVPLRYLLIAEEFAELTGALYGPEAEEDIQKEIMRVMAASYNTDYRADTVEAADALADLVYVVYGFALETGIPLDTVLLEVQRSNLSKLGEDGKPVRRKDGKILKGPNFSEPNIQAILEGSHTPPARDTAIQRILEMLEEEYQSVSRQGGLYARGLKKAISIVKGVQNGKNI